MPEEIDEVIDETIVAPISEEETAEPAEEVVEPTEEESELEKLRRDNENYKQELAGYRKPNVAKIQKDVQINSSDKSYEIDFKSKSADVLDELGVDINNLKPAEYQRIQNLIAPAMKVAFDEAVKKGSYVARGKLKSVVSELVSFARGNKVEKPVDQEQLDSAEISAVRPVKKVNTIKATERDAQIAVETGASVAVITANRLAREKREADFNKNKIHV